MSAENHVFVALYAGPTIGQAKIIAASSDPEIVDFASKRMLHERDTLPANDSIVEALNQSKRGILKLIQGNEGRQE